MDELFDMILDAICSFFGIEYRRDRGPGILRWIFRVLLRVFLILFGILMTLMSFLQIRRMRRHRWVSVLVLVFTLSAIAFCVWYFGFQ